MGDNQESRPLWSQTVFLCSNFLIMDASISRDIIEETTPWEKKQTGQWNGLDQLYRHLTNIIIMHINIMLLKYIKFSTLVHHLGVLCGCRLPLTSTKTDPVQNLSTAHPHGLLCTKCTF